MDLVAVAGALDALAVPDADRARSVHALQLVARLRCLVDAVEMRWNRRLEELARLDTSLNPEHVNAEATGRSLRKATDAVRRASRAVTAPVVADAVEDGSISGEHLDAFVRALHSLTKEQRPRLLELQHELVRVAQRSTVEDFTVRLRAVVRDIEGDDGRSRLERQRRERGVRTWTGKDGMWNLHGRFDPETALGLIEALRRETERLFHGEHPVDAPADPLLRQQWFQAQALANLMQGRGARSSEPEFVIVMDHDTFATGERRPDSRVDCGCELDLPIDALLRLAQRARFTPVILDRDGRVVAQGSRVSSPDELVASLRDPVGLDRGRSRRHADRAQRRALRAMYRHCAIPGCRVPFQKCEIHHLVRWEDGGPTDLHNLLPVCAHHHDRIHADGWLLELAADRSLTVRRQGVIAMATGPPREQWAA